MIAKEALKVIEKYYGKYTNMFIASMVLDWLNNFQYPLDKFVKILMKEYSLNYGKAPDIAIMEKVKNKNIAVLKKLKGDYITAEGEVYINHTMIGHYDEHRFIPALYLLNSKKMVEYCERYEEFRTPDKYADFAEVKSKEIIKR